MPGGVEKARRQLIDAREKDPKAQLWPEISISIIAQGDLRAGESKAATEIFELNLLAYSDSADAEDSLADAYLANGQKDLARKHAERALALLDSHSLPASSWTDTDQYRGEIRADANDVLKKLGQSKAN
jgi:tetratricopeptide (TPR) repeat protein